MNQHRLITDRFEQIADAVCERLARNQRVRRNLPGEGRLRMDRQLPFLCVYRRPTDREDPGTQDLVTSEAAYLFTSAAGEFHEGLTGLCRRIDLIMLEHFGTFLILEIWSEEDSESNGWLGLPPWKPMFQLVTADARELPSTLDAFTAALSEMTLRAQSPEVRIVQRSRVAPEGLPPLREICAENDKPGCCLIGLAVRPIYRHSQTGGLYPLLLQRMREQLARALRQAIARFTRPDAAGDHGFYASLGPTTMVKAARLVDQQLCDVAETFDFLLQVTPVNSDTSWEEFQNSRYQSEPRFYYRPLPYRPALLKRQLFQIEIERVEDPTLAWLFWEKQDELDRQLSALRDLDTPDFLHESMQLYGGADPELMQLAHNILARYPQPVVPDDQTGSAPLTEVLRLAREEIEYYRRKLPDFDAKLEVCDQIASGMMVSLGRLLISPTVQLRPQRIPALLHHEVGTHLLTYFNGQHQPFQQLSTGLAGYEELQEGLAVLAEYLSGGLTPNRLRTLAARVLAVQWRTAGVPFVETFARLHHDHGFTPHRAFVTTLRVFRGGGLTKDVIYLRGLRDVLAWLAQGHEIEPLYVGKIGLQHFPYVQEMRRRGMIQPPAVLPRFWEDRQLRERLEACRGLTIMQLLEK